MGPRQPDPDYIPSVFLSRRRQHYLDRKELPPQKDKPLPKVLSALEKHANSSLKKGPFSVTFTDYVAPSGDKRDFLSYAPYWWPESKIVKDHNGKEREVIEYVRKDGKENPDVKLLPNPRQLSDLTECLLYLALGYYFLKDERYVKKAAELFHVWFADETTRMNPSVNYGQIIRGEGKGHGVGRKEGILSTRGIARIANYFPLFTSSSNFPSDLRDTVMEWFAAYTNWLQTSPIGQACSRSNNNHETWYYVQLISLLIVLGRIDEARERLRHFMNDTWCKKQCETGGECDQPLESERTRPFHYQIFNEQPLIYLLTAAEDLGIADEVWGCGNDSPKRSIDFTIKCWYEKAIPTHGKAKPIESRADPTELVGCVLHVMKRYGDNDGTYAAFVKEAREGDNGEKISGTKHILRKLWEIDG